MANIRDVARKAGVAPITVSRVINDSEYVSAEVRSRVEKAIAELNYVPNRLGPSMRSKRSNTIGLIVTDITNPFWTTPVPKGAIAYKAIKTAQTQALLATHCWASQALCAAACSLAGTCVRCVATCVLKRAMASLGADVLKRHRHIYIDEGRTERV